MAMDPVVQPHSRAIRGYGPPEEIVCLAGVRAIALTVPQPFIHLPAVQWLPFILPGQDLPAPVGPQRHCKDWFS